MVFLRRGAGVGARKGGLTVDSDEARARARAGVDIGDPFADGAAGHGGRLLCIDRHRIRHATDRAGKIAAVLRTFF